MTDPSDEPLDGERGGNAPVTGVVVAGPLLAAAARAKLEELAVGARDVMEAEHADNTKRAYRADWQDFTIWCAEHGVEARPAAPAALILYLQSLVEAGRRVSTVERRVAAIHWYHRDQKMPSPADDPSVRQYRRGLRRKHGRPPEKKAAAVLEQLRAMLPEEPTLRAVRDRAVLLLGWAGAFRRSEVAALDVADCRYEGPKRLVITVRRSKTDQEGAGMTKVILRGKHAETCPVRALELWREAAEITDGALFRRISKHGTAVPGRLSDRAIARIVQEAARRAGLDPAAYGGHSLRSGFITEAYLQDVPEADIMEQSGHKSIPVARSYRQVRDLRRRDAAGQVGL